MHDLPYDPKKIRVLVVDDHDLIRKSISKLLVKMNFKEIYEAPNGAEAINIYSQKVIDFIICDLYMTKTNGFEVLSHVRNRQTNSDIPFIVVTGESSKDDIVKAVDLGADDYMLKPFQAADFEKKITQMLTKYHSPIPLLFNIRKSERAFLDGDLERASALISKAMTISPDSARAIHFSAIIQEKQQKIEGAILTLKDNIRKNPRFLKNYTTLADFYLKNDQTEKAIECMQSELELNPKNLPRQLQLAQLLEDSCDFAGAIEHCRSALLEDSKNKTALMGMGRAYAKSDNLEKAVYYFKRLRRHHPNDAKSLEAVVKYSMAANNPRYAEMALLDEKRTNPRRLDTYVVLAQFYSSIGNDELALKATDEALVKNPDSVELLNLKGSLLHKGQDFDGAIETYKKIIARSSDINAYLQLAEILLHKEKYGQVIQILEKALKFEDQTIQIFYWLNIATTKAKQYTKTYFILKKLLQMGIKDEKVVLSAKKAKSIILSRRRPKQKVAV